MLIVSAGTWGLITDAPADLERGEDYQIMTLTEGARKSLRTLLGIPEKVRKESTGRPKKYSVEKDGMEIFLAHVYEGQSIKRIALERDMSPTTVQKLLNEARLIAADNLVQGVWSASPDSANYQKNLDVLAWAAQHTTGEKKAACEVTVNKKSDALTRSKVWITPENWSDYFNLEILPRYDDDGNLTDRYSVITSWKDRNTFVSSAEYDFLVKYTIDCKATNGADAVREGERTVRKEFIQGGTEGGPNYVSYDPGSLKYTVTGTPGYAYIYDWDAVESYTTRTISELKREEVDVITLKNGNTFRGWEHGKITWPPEG